MTKHFVITGNVTATYTRFNVPVPCYPFHFVAEWWHLPKRQSLPSLGTGFTLFYLVLLSRQFHDCVLRWKAQN